MNHNDASSIALAVTLGETEKTHDAKRELFEAAAYDHYVERTEGTDVYVMTAAELCRRLEDGKYHFRDLEACWWGFQAGFMAAAVAGSMAVNDAAAG